MKISRNTAMALAVAAFAAAAYVYVTRSADPVVAGTSAKTSEMPGAPLAEVKVPASLSKEAAAGKTYYTAICASCHGANAAGQDGLGPPLVDAAYLPGHHGDAAFVTAARNGVREHDWSFGNMPAIAQPLTDAEIKAIIAYIRELQRENGIF